MTNPGLVPWMTDARDAWLADATAWINDMVASLGLGPQPDVASFREKPWGAILRGTTGGRDLFFKAVGFGGWHEPRLLLDLSKPWPDLVPDVLAVDLERSWVLMADNGVAMMHTAGADEQLDAFAHLLPLYAQMQQASPALVQTWIDARTPDRRTAGVPERLDRLLAGELWGGPLPIEPELRARIDANLPIFEEVCDELAAGPFADTLDHGDMHGGNVLLGAGTPRLVDWGDSCIGHPFASLYVTYEVSLTRLDGIDKGAEAHRLRDVYLEPWTSIAPAQQLRSTFIKALWLAYITRALDYVHMLDGAGSDQVAEWHGDIVGHLARWCEVAPLLDRGDEMIDAIVAQVPN